MRHVRWAALWLVVGCGHLDLGSWEQVSAWWEAGARTRAVEEAAATYRAFLEDNGLDGAEIARQTEAVRARLGDEVIFIPGERTPPSARIDGASLPSPSLDHDLRADLLSPRATVALRAVETVRGLGLGRHARGLLAVVYRRAPYRDEGGLLADQDTATRSVVCKRAALEALQALVEAP